MLDSYTRAWIDPPLNYLGKRLARIPANAITLVGFAFGLVAMGMIAGQQYDKAVVFIGLNRLFDGLDGAIARHNGLSDFGGFLDIVCDFIVYSGVVFAFGLADYDHLFYALFLVFSFIGPIVSFLAYAIMAAKHEVNTARVGRKSFYYLGGICEGTETAVVLILLCVFVDYFNAIALVYGVLCWLTTLGRVYNAWVDFGHPASTILTDASDNVYTEPAKELESQAQ